MTRGTDVPVTLAQLCASLPGVLRPWIPVEAPEASLDAVHISELVDPTPFLHGQELLLTTGLTLPGTGAGMRAYVSRLRECGIAAVALGLGPVHRMVPSVLERACERQGLPLLVVPVEASFQQVTRTFWSLIGAAQERSLHAALDSHRRLVVAATADEPVPALLGVLGQAIDGQIVVTDQHGAIVRRWPDTVEPSPELIEALRRQRSIGHRSVATFPVGERIGSVHPITAGSEVVGHLHTVSAQPLAPHNRGLLLATMAMLGLDAHHRRRGLSVDRKLRAAVAHLLDRGHVEAAASMVAATPVEAPPTQVRVVVVRGGPGKGRTALVAVAESSDNRGWWGDCSEYTAWALLHPGHYAADPKRLHRVLSRVGPEAVAATGPLVGLEDIHAMRTRLEAIALGLSPGTVRTCLGSEGAPFVTEDWARGVLRPLTGRPDLVAAVAAFLGQRGNWERAARELGVHRNSVRSRLAQAERLLGGDLTDPDLAAQTWIALRASGLDAVGAE